MSSADIKEWLVEQFENRGAQSLEKDWKRRSKSKNDQGEAVRVFEHPTLGTYTIIESKTGNFRFEHPESLPLNTASPSHHYNFILGDIDIEDDCVVFFCGEEVGGSLCDQHSDAPNAMLRAAFSDRLADLSLSNAESMHSIALQDGEDPEKLALYIITALTGQGVSNRMDSRRLQEVLGKQYDVYKGLETPQDQDGAADIVLFGIGPDDLVSEGLYFEVDGPGFEEDDGKSGAFLEHLFAERMNDGTLSVFMTEYTHTISFREDETPEQLAFYIVQKFKEFGGTVSIDDDTLKELLGDYYGLLNASTPTQSSASAPTKTPTLFERFPPTQEELDENKEYDMAHTGYIILTDLQPGKIIRKQGIAFTCGFELEGGEVNEQHSEATDAMMKFIFSDREKDGTLFTSMAESHHGIELRDGETVEELALHIVNTLIEAGVKVKVPQRDLKAILGNSYGLPPKTSHMQNGALPPSSSTPKPVSDNNGSEFDLQSSLAKIFSSVVAEQVVSSTAGQSDLFKQFPPTAYDLEYSSSLEFSGRVILCYIQDEGDFLIAFCGFEMSDGTLFSNHSEATTAMMHHIFPGWQNSGKMHTQIEENAHAFYGKEGELFALQEHVIATLEKAGVVKAPYFESDIEPPAPKSSRKTGWRN